MVGQVLSRGRCTQIIVAHRLATIRDADKIVVSKRGKVVQNGRHKYLKNEEGSFAEKVS